MKSLKQQAKDFYQSNQDYLLSHYPGLSLHRIHQELEESDSYLVPVDLEGPYWQIDDDPAHSLFSGMNKGVPLEYITKRAYFYTSQFYVDERVLIPRSETELLVERAVSLIKNNKYKTMVDVGVGSGNILISILKDVAVPLNAYATDISQDAIDVASMNLKKHYYQIHPDCQISFQVMDRLSLFCGKVDLVVSNPPYIKRSESLKSVHHQVDKFEPSTALYLNDDEYEKWFFDFFVQVFDTLNPGGSFLMEGHEDLLQKLKSDLEGIGFGDIEVLQDYTGRDRSIQARRSV